MSTTGITTGKVTPTPHPLEAEGTPWLVRLREDMTLRDFRERTQEAYELASRLLVRHFGRPPESITEEDLRGYFSGIKEGYTTWAAIIAASLLLMRWRSRSSASSAAASAAKHTSASARGSSRCAGKRACAASQPTV